MYCGLLCVTNQMFSVVLGFTMETLGACAPNHLEAVQQATCIWLWFMLLIFLFGVQYVQYCTLNNEKIYA